MSWNCSRRDFVKSAIISGGFCASGDLAGLAAVSALGLPGVPGLVSPGCRGTKVRIGRIFAGQPKAHWPTPSMDVQAEKKRYETAMAEMAELADVEFVSNELVSTVEQARRAAEAVKDTDGILLIHLSMGISPLLNEILAAGKSTVLFAAPYSGHEWTRFGGIAKTNPLFDCTLTSDLNQLAAAVRPLRAIHHLREAHVLNVTERPWAAERTQKLNEKFGTRFTVVNLQRVLDAYESTPERAARAEADAWIQSALAVVEPSEDEVVRSCRLALAFEKIMDEEKATVITADCYGTMYHKLPAFPCIGNVRLNDKGLGGICESDLNCAMTHILLQGLTGKPGFISDPTMDESKEAIILAHCLGSRKMDGPEGPPTPYKLRTIMERQEGCVPQVFMRVGQPVTQCILIGADLMRYFTGTIIDTPDTDRGCRTKIAVKIDGSPRKVWENWAHGLHRQTVYGHITDDLRRFCKFQQIEMLDEAV